MKNRQSGKLRLFIENFLVYGLGGVISKIIPLIMIPIVTRIMPRAEYFGINDLSSTVVSFCSAIVIMGMYDAMYRMFFEKDDEEFKRTVCSTALIFTIVMSIIVFITVLLSKDLIAKYFFNDEKYAYIVYLSAIAILVGATNSIISAPTRMQNKRRIFLITNTLAPILSYSVAIYLLLSGYYVIALPLAGIISAFVLEITFGFLNKNWFSLRSFDISLLKQLLIIAVPLLPNFLIYWIFNSCDKVMIANMLGIRDAGIYAVGSKLGHVSQLIYLAFAGGWQYFAFSTMKEKNQVESNSRIFEYLGILSFISATFICAWSFGIFNILFKEEYVSGYIIAPYLFLAPLLLMLFQVIGNQFLVVKKTWPVMFILFSGAIFNIIINYILIPILGIEGAAIATLVGYTISDIVCVIVLCKTKLMVISIRFIIATIIMTIYMLLWRLFFSNNCVIGTCVATLTTMLLIVIYKHEFYELIRKI